MVDSQPSLRLQDIEVGDNRHTTFSKCLEIGLWETILKRSAWLVFRFLLKNLDFQKETLCKCFEGTMGCLKIMNLSKYGKALEFLKAEFSFMGKENWWSNSGTLIKCWRVLEGRFRVFEFDVPHVLNLEKNVTQIATAESFGNQNSVFINIKDATGLPNFRKKC